MQSAQPTSDTNNKNAAPRRRRRFGFASLGAVLGVTSLAGWGLWELATPRPDETLYVSANIAGEVRFIRVEAFHPAISSNEAKPHPAVILLHGVEGPSRYWRRRNQSAHALRGEGYSVFIVHYFDSVNYRDLWHFAPNGQLDVDRIERNYRLVDYPRWTAAVTAVMAEVALRHDIDPERIALDGYSLGGYVALHAASECQQRAELPRPRAVVVNWAAKWPETKVTPGFPPTQWIHGECDTVIQPQWAQASVSALLAAGAKADLHLVSDAGHQAGSPQATQITFDFLAKHFDGPAANSIAPQKP